MSAHALERIAMRHDDARIGEALEQPIEPPQVRRALEEPPAPGALPIDEAQQVGVVAIDGTQILGEKPFPIRRKERLDAELHPRHRVREQLDAFLGTVRAHLVDLRELGVRLARALERGAERDEPRILLAGREAVDRIGMVPLPEQERTVLGVGGEQIEKSGRPGARQSGEIQRPFDPPLADLRVVRERRCDSQTVLEQPEQPAARALAGAGTEARPVVRLQEHAEALAELLATEIGEPGSRARLGEQRIFVEHRDVGRRLRHVRLTRTIAHN
jgi:hypothetical protein